MPGGWGAWRRGRRGSTRYRGEGGSGGGSEGGSGSGTGTHSLLCSPDDAATLTLTIHFCPSWLLITCRGYLPALTYSSHYIRDPRLRTAVDAFVTRERMQLELALQEQVPLVSPFKDAGASSSGDEE